MAMNADKLKYLIERYESGVSTLEEERMLFDHFENSDSSLGAWATFVKQNKSDVPRDLSESLWQSFEGRKPRKSRLLIKLFSAAAAVLLAIVIFIGFPTNDKQSYSEKEALLNEARNMFTKNDSPKYYKNEIIYETDEMIIYSHSKFTSNK